MWGRICLILCCTHPCLAALRTAAQNMDAGQKVAAVCQTYSSSYAVKEASFDWFRENPMQVDEAHRFHGSMYEAARLKNNLIFL